MQLTAGRSPMPRKKEYVQVDSDLWAAKLEFSQTIGWIFAMAQQLTWDWSMQQFQCVSYHYLRRCSYFLGCWHCVTVIEDRPNGILQTIGYCIHSILAWLNSLVQETRLGILFVVGCSEPTNLSHQHRPIGRQRTTGSAHHRRRPNAGMPFVLPQGTIAYA